MTSFSSGSGPFCMGLVSPLAMVIRGVGAVGEGDGREGAAALAAGNPSAFRKSLPKKYCFVIMGEGALAANVV